MAAGSDQGGTAGDAGDWTPHGLAMRAAEADRRARVALAGAAADLALPAAGRLDARTRTALLNNLAAAVGAIEASIRRTALRAAGEGALAGSDAVQARLAAAGTLHDPALLDEMLARIRQDTLAAALPVVAGGPDEPSLLVRLSTAPDAQVARAAAGLLAAESRRRAQHEEGRTEGDELPTAIHAALTWAIAAAMRGDSVDAGRDRALADAARRRLAAYEDHERSDALAMRLAMAIDPRPVEIASLVVEAIGDRRLGFFIALIAHMLRLPFEQARTIVIESEGDRLWMALRALKLERAALAQVALALAEADPARDMPGFADALDAIAAIPAPEAEAALLPLTLDPRFVAAVRALDAGRPA